MAQRCVTAVACTSSRMCPGQVCDTAAGFCVDCVTDVDCTGGTVCRANLCVAPPRACRSDRECSDLNMVCDEARSQCVECAADTDCTAAQFCADTTCRPRVCTPGAASCVDTRQRQVCDARGAAMTVVACGATENCRDGACVPRACTPGEARCRSTAEREVCNADGAAYTASACAAMTSCLSGACTPWTCTPGAASCGASNTRAVCNPDGLTNTSTSCPAMTTCRSGACTPWSCTPRAATCSGSDMLIVCNDDGLGSTASSCPRPAHSTATTCSGGVCGVVCETGYMASGGACVSTTPANPDTCPGVEVVPGGATISINTSALRTSADVGTVCGSRSSTSPGWADWVAHFTLTATRDVTVSVTSSSSSVRVQLQASCLPTAPQIGPCLAGSTIIRRYLSLPPGDYYVIGESNASLTTPVQVRVDAAAATPRLPGDTCPGVDVTPDGPLVTLSPSTFVTTSDQGTSCGSIRPNDGYIDWVYHFRLASPRDVTLNLTNVTYSTSMQLQTSCGVGSTTVGGCVNGVGTSIARTHHALPAGDYYVVVESPSVGAPTAASLGITTAAPSARLAGDTCATAVTVPTTGAVTTLPIGTFDPIYDHGTPCGSGASSNLTWTDWVFSYTLTSERDVIITMSPSSSVPVYGIVETGCGVAASAVGTCSSTSSTGWLRRIPRQPAGTYYVIGETGRAPTSLAVTVEAFAPGALPTYTQSAPPSSVAWVDACAVAGHSEHLPGADDESVRVPLPFAFRYWGVNLPATSNVNLTSNGWLSLDGGAATTLRGTIPNVASPNAVIAPYWGDNFNRHPQCVATVGTAPNRRWVAEWNDEVHCCTDDPAVHLTYEVILSETTNTIDFLYDTMTGATAHAVGLENQDGSAGINVCDAATTCIPTAGQRIRFTPSP